MRARGRGGPVHRCPSCMGWATYDRTLDRYSHRTRVRTERCVLAALRGEVDPRWVDPILGEAPGCMCGCRCCAVAS